MTFHKQVINIEFTRQTTIATALKQLITYLQSHSLIDYWKKKNI